MFGNTYKDGKRRLTILNQHFVFKSLGEKKSYVKAQHSVQDILCSTEKWRILFSRWLENNPTDNRVISKNALEDTLSPEDSMIIISAHTQE